MATESNSNLASPLAFFVAGMIVPTIAYYFLAPKISTTETTDVDGEWEDDDDSASSSSSGFASPNSPGTAAQWGMSDAPYKMVLCVNQSLGMGKGKIAAQCGHAAVGCYKGSMRHSPNALHAWEETGCAKIAVKCPSEEEMERIAAVAREKGIPCYIVEDAGRTQIAAGSRTVLGLGPAPVGVFDGVTSHLKLM